jgi:hypothetical protein
MTQSVGNGDDYAARPRVHVTSVACDLLGRERSDERPGRDAHHDMVFLATTVVPTPTRESISS